MAYQSELWMNYLYKIKDKADVSSFNIKKGQKYSAVIVEPRKTEMLQLVIINFMYFLSDEWSLYIFHGKSNEEYVKEITKGMGDIYYINMGVDNLGINNYNNLLTRKYFYQKIHSENILIFQIDTILRKKIPKEFLEYDYVGAPWEMRWLGCPLGNGGLSLRKKSSMIDIIERFPFDKFGGNEDVYFSYFLMKLGKICPVEKAMQFSVETIFYHDPIGLHKPNDKAFPKEEYEKLFNEK